jgi:ketosteroid isomerase-like protein
MHGEFISQPRHRRPVLMLINRVNLQSLKLGSAELRTVLLLVAAAPLLAASLVGQTPAVPSIPAQASVIQGAILAQADAWNRGDIPAFMETYENSPDTTFVGLTVRKGYETILERYRQGYSTPEQMGRLTFSNIEVRLLPSECGQSEYAVVTGNFHLDRAAHGEAKKDDGIFSLVWHRGTNGWKIVLDHTS